MREVWPRTDGLVRRGVSHVRRESCYCSGGEDLDSGAGPDHICDNLHAGVRISEDHDRHLSGRDPDRNGTFRQAKGQASFDPTSKAAETTGASNAISDSQFRQRALCPGLRLFPAIRVRNVYGLMEPLARI